MLGITFGGVLDILSAGWCRGSASYGADRFTFGRYLTIAAVMEKAACGFNR
jgi:hypothetical protein